MTKIYTTGRTTKAWRKLALLGLLGLATGAAHAQNLNYNTFGASNTPGTYTDLGASATVIATPNTDDANSAATPIGFSFNFNGQAFTDFVLNTNGYLALGTTAPSAPYFPTSSTTTTSGPLNDAAQTNLLLPFNTDLESAAAGPAVYSYQLSGTAPNRICTIQWKGVSDKSAATPAKQYASLDFQVKLYETSNRVEFVYNTATASANADAFKSAVVGLKGVGAAANQVLLASKGSTAAWATTTFISTTYLAGSATGVNAHNFRQSVGPDAGRTYRFNAIQEKDIAVQQVYALSKLPIPYGTPETIRAYVRNTGTTAQNNVTFTLKVTGANTFTTAVTIASIPVDIAGIVSFAPFTPTNEGTNTMTVTVTEDGNNFNNSASTTQLVNKTTYAYAQPDATTTGSLGVNAGGIMGNKYTTSAPRTVTGVTVRLSDVKSVGNTVYGVVLDGNGSIIARSPDYKVLAADIDKDKTFVVNGPVAPGSFIVGLAQTPGAANYFPVGLQGSEKPTRTEAYYVISSLTGGTPADVSESNYGAFMIDAITDVPPTCLPPTDITITNLQPNSAVITLTGGSANGTGYTIIYGPKGFDPAVSGTTVTVTASPYTLSNLLPSTNYEFYIRTICSASDQSSLVGPRSFFTPCVPPIVSTFPYTENFDGVAAGALPCGVAVADINADAKTWSVVTTGTPASAPNHMRYAYSADNAADDWFFTPALFLRAGTSYQLTFKYKAAGATFAEGLEVKYGNATTPAAQSNLLWRNIAIVNTAYATTAAGNDDGQVKAITPTTSGNYYIGFHAISAKNKFNLYVDDISVTATAITASSSALQQAINLYPNPTAGNLTVDVRGANAKNGLQVEVTNMLGQRVHTETVRDNATKTIDLSKLANGMYTVKVRNGAEYMVRTISVQK
ncbi:T9SS type A sorting domain-containing protein [Hymenobacter actinosclerus]|uniref:Por secretion system C-terminal sorting domain-containing protein n=1 Tax=Hymenobacter actinosclerus TaxID=82805 RepID=A0A1I0HKM1_9BACT|nr:T9SS type A sorting domain-containing protein [Hymenobacter actinosclerus]SET84266.1 Por secretion system C-terminal sorting domain-containing protein [Hymenobacter actinosclerus]